MTEHENSAPAQAPVTVTREGHRRFTGRSERGGVVAIGDASYPDTFTPGELLKVALAACAGFSAESAIERRLGDDAHLTVSVSGDKDLDEERYPELTEVLTVDWSELDEAGRQRLTTVITRAIDQVCTVGRTLKAGAHLNVQVAGDPAEPSAQ